VNEFFDWMATQVAKRLRRYQHVVLAGVMHATLTNDELKEWDKLCLTLPEFVAFESAELELHVARLHAGLATATANDVEAFRTAVVARDRAADAMRIAAGDWYEGICAAKPRPV
jgi:hypothetical protein